MWVRVPALALRLPARKAGVVAAVLAALSYSLLTGFAIPAQRTVLMLAAIAACVLADRHGSPSRVLALAALVVVAADPWAVLSPGFWLSFGAVGARSSTCSRCAPVRAGKVRGAALEQLAVTLAMLPMLLALFQEVSLVSPLANALAIPVVSLVVVPLSLAGAFLGAGVLLDAAHQLMAWLMVPLEALVALGPARCSRATLPCRGRLSPRSLGARGSSRRAASRCGRWEHSGWRRCSWCCPRRPRPEKPGSTCSTSGTASPSWCEPRRHALVYDAGPTWNAEADSGSRIVVPFLRGEGVRRLDGVVVSHGDDDHYGGAASVARTRRPGWLLSSLAADDPLHRAFATSMRCESGQRWSWDGVRFEVLHPGAEAYLQERRKRNDFGCVLRIASPGASVLLAADVEARSESEMLTRDAHSVRSDVLLVPHHGSKTSSTVAFLDAVAPRVALLSVAHRDRFRHPHAEVMARYGERSIVVHRTDRRGALRLILPRDAAALEVLGQEARVRYWSDRRG